MGSLEYIISLLAALVSATYKLFLSRILWASMTITSSNSKPLVNKVLPMHLPSTFLPKNLIRSRCDTILSYMVSVDLILRMFNIEFKTSGRFGKFFRLYRKYVISLHSPSIIWSFDFKDSNKLRKYDATILSSWFRLTLTPLSLNQLSISLLLTIVR